MEDRARSAAASAQAKTGDSDQLLKNFVSPGLSGQPISTIDGGQTFNPRIACQKSASFLEIIAQPANSGDIGALRISRDTDLDGRLDQTLSVSMPISGICANGIISCEPGTWAQCRYFNWQGGGAVSLTETDMPALSGCYCINNSCGTGLAWSNMASVLKDIGGGVVGALTTDDPRIGIARAAIDGPMIRYTGAQTAACTDNPLIAATGYRAAPAAIQGDAFAASQTSSLFQSLAGSPAGLGSASQQRACSIARTVSIKEVPSEDVIARTSGGYASSVDAFGNTDFYLGSPGYRSLRGGSCGLFDFRMTLTVGEVDRLRAASLSYLSADDWAQLRIDGDLVFSGPVPWTGSGLPPDSCEMDGATSYTPNIDLLPYLINGNHEVWLRIAVGDKGDGFAQIHAEADTSCKTAEQLVDLCTGYAADPACRIWNETIDGVETLRQGVATGLKPLPQTRLVGSGTCAISLTRDFFTRERHYLCSAATSESASPDLSRGAYIIDHSTEKLLADRTVAKDGTTAITSRSFALPERPSVSACEPLCKTRAPRPSDGAAPAGVVAAMQNRPIGWDTFYHACGAGGICPLGPGEELVSACGCLDDFPEAAVMMQTVRLGGADLVCTANPR